MAWTTPPTFSDGAILSASQLNILSADLEYLYALLQAPQPASSTLYANRDLNSTNNSWRYIDVNAQGLTVGTIYNVYFTTALATQNISAILIQDLIMAEGTSL